MGPNLQLSVLFVRNMKNMTVSSQCGFLVCWFWSVMLFDLHMLCSRNFDYLFCCCSNWFFGGRSLWRFGVTLSALVWCFTDVCCFTSSHIFAAYGISLSCSKFVLLWWFLLGGFNQGVITYRGCCFLNYGWLFSFWFSVGPGVSRSR